MVSDFIQVGGGFIAEGKTWFTLARIKLIVWANASAFQWRNILKPPSALHRTHIG